MFTWKNFWIFLAGAQFFHTLSVVMIPFAIQLPIEMDGVTLTSTIINWAIAINLLITVGLLWLASRVKS